MDMEQIVGGLTDFMIGQIGDYEQLRDFGLDPKAGEMILRQVKEYMTRVLLKMDVNAENVSLKVKDEVIGGAEAVAEKIRELTQENLEDDILLGGDNVLTHNEPNFDRFDVVWEADGWEKVSEFIDQIPPLDKQKEHCLKFRMKNVKMPEDFAFALFMWGAMLAKHDVGDVLMGCTVLESKDGKNHFALMREK